MRLKPASGTGNIYTAKRVHRTAMAADLSFRLGWIDENLQTRTVDLLKRFDLPIEVPRGSMTKEKFMDLMAVDKKASQGKMNFILLKAIWASVFTGDFDQNKVARNVGSFEDGRISR